MTRFLTVFLALAAHTAAAADAPLSADEIRARLEVSGEVFVVDDSGKRLQYAPSQVATWRAEGTSPIESRWGSSWKFGHVFLHHVWTVGPDGKITVLIEEFARENEAKNFTDLLKKTELVVENFAPITWKVLNGSQKGLIVRLTPTLREIDEAKELGELPIAAHNVIVMDNKGFLWTEGGSFDGTYVGLTTHRGTIVVSFKPFKGAKVLGEAVEHEIRLDLVDNLRVKLHSDTAFLPTKFAAKVYGLYRPDLVAKGPHSTHTFTSSTEDRILEALEKAH